MLKVLYYKSEGRRFDPRSCHWNFSFTQSFRSHSFPGIDSASNRNEYQQIFLGINAARCVRLTNITPSCAVVMKSGNLNFLEPSGSLQACNGPDLPFHILLVLHLCKYKCSVDVYYCIFLRVSLGFV